MCFYIRCQPLKQLRDRHILQRTNFMLSSMTTVQVLFVIKPTHLHRNYFYFLRKKKHFEKKLLLFLEKELPQRSFVNNLIHMMGIKQWLQALCFRHTLKRREVDIKKENIRKKIELSKRPFVNCGIRIDCKRPALDTRWNEKQKTEKISTFISYP